MSAHVAKCTLVEALGCVRPIACASMVSVGCHKIIDDEIRVGFGE